ncbi:hypothetical protein T440DRAFT_473088 [Plenodomus tracheiphilus IPT5]|uniref:MARVEL domain-containing protein n=1 Tax=Plenodomus tracheiphilus IPT5 TaxID=1408161 RepID=A0A6A7AQ59_9PLEO|nr:hypothetical protein T440DRAFT_473088 [Plenodomus tracheiphilus IPT5]
MALLTTEQSQTRFLAIVLPTLTLCTHTLLALSSVLPGSDPDRACFSLLYNALAAGASILGLLGAIRLVPSLVSIYTLIHTTTLSFATIALVNAPFNFGLINPVIPSWQIDENAICRDIDAGFGWDEEWLVKCSKSFSLVKLCVAAMGLFLMVAQWWALMTVRRWGKELRFQRRLMECGSDVEKAGILRDDHVLMNEKSGL